MEESLVNLVGHTIKELAPAAQVLCRKQIILKKLGRMGIFNPLQPGWHTSDAIVKAVVPSQTPNSRWFLPQYPPLLVSYACPYRIRYDPVVHLIMPICGPCLSKDMGAMRICDPGLPQRSKSKQSTILGDTAERAEQRDALARRLGRQLGHAARWKQLSLSEQPFGRSKAVEGRVAQDEAQH